MAKDDNIELLEKDLNFDRAKTVLRDSISNYLIIPINEDLKTKKNLDKNSTLTLLLITDKSGNIKYGNVVYYLPIDGVKRDTLSSTTFQAIFSDKQVDNNGVFRFLSVTGRWMFDLTFKQNKLYSSGIVKTKNDSTQRTNGCNAWFLVTTYVNPDGSTYDTWDYLGTTCDGCGDPNYQSLCPDNGNGGGSSNNSNNTVTEDINFTTDEEDFADEDYDFDNSGVPTLAEPITYNHFAQILRDAGTWEILDVNMSPTTAQPIYSYYIDRYNRNVTRYITLLNHLNTHSLISPFLVRLNWSCQVNGQYIYTDGSPRWSRQWGHAASKFD